MKKVCPKKEKRVENHAARRGGEKKNSGAKGNPRVKPVAVNTKKKKEPGRMKWVAPDKFWLMKGLDIRRETHLNKRQAAQV